MLTRKEKRRRKKCAPICLNICSTVGRKNTAGLTFALLRQVAARDGTIAVRFYTLSSLLSAMHSPRFCHEIEPPLHSALFHLLPRQLRSRNNLNLSSKPLGRALLPSKYKVIKLGLTATMSPHMVHRETRFNKQAQTHTFFTLT